MIARLDAVGAVAALLLLVIVGVILAALVFLATSAPTDERPMPMPTSVPGPPVVTR